MREQHEIPEGGWRYATDRISRGSGIKTGRRPARLATSKRELTELVAQLHERGLGQNSIAYLLGYSPLHISRLLRGQALPAHNYGTTISAIIRHLPPAVLAQCRVIHTKSKIAHERAAIRQGLVEHQRVVHVLPED